MGVNFLDNLFSDQTKADAANAISTAIVRNLNDQLGNPDENLKPRVGVATVENKAAMSGAQMSTLALGLGVAAVAAYIFLRK